MDSFYGGRHGFSFIIIKNFASIAEMISCFNQGPDYTAVHYDEHVLINTENKNDIENGKVYRRGYDYTNDMGGAIYVGTIVGPSGFAPFLNLSYYDDIKNIITDYDGEQAVDENNQPLYYIVDNNGFPTYKTTTTVTDYPVYKRLHYSLGQYNPTVNLVPGWDGNSTYQDAIQWISATVRTDNNEDADAYIGFIIPYLVEQFDASSVSPYYNRDNNTSNFTNTDLIERTDDGSHPYYESWNISIPKGIQGDSLKDFRVITADSTVESYSGQSDDINNNRKILVYDYYNYETNASGDPITLYLGDYNMISDITLDDNGTITIKYTHNDDTVYSKIIKWVTDVVVNDDGTVTVTFNTGATLTTTTQLRWITNVSIETDSGSGEGSGDQKVHVYYNTGEEEIIGEPLNYILDMVITENYHVLVYYSDPEKRQEIKDAGENYTYNGSDEWYLLGTIKDESGILVGLNIDSSIAGSTISDVIQYLNEQYPEGLQGTDLRGKVVTIGNDDDSKNFYAYDYLTNTWYYLGSFNSDVSNVFMVAAETDEDYSTKTEELAVGGLWFVVTVDEVSDNGN